VVIWRTLRSSTTRRPIISSTRGRGGGWWCIRWFTPRVRLSTFQRNPTPIGGTSDICKDHRCSRRGGGSIRRQEVMQDRRRTTRHSPWSMQRRQREGR
jgi:hypothetical protein